MISMESVKQKTGKDIWSEYQMRVFDAVANTDRNIVVQATAGSGKTTVLVGIANLLDASNACRFLAFNKEIALELKDRMPSHFNSSTIHSYAYGVLAKTLYFGKADPWKLKNICYAAGSVVAGQERMDKQEQEQFSSSLFSLINMVRLTRTDYKNIDDMIDLCAERGLVGYSPMMTPLYDAVFEIIYWSASKERNKNDLSSMAYSICQTLETSGYKGCSAIPNRPWVDFTDMVELPLLWNAVPAENDFVLWDEAQDGNQLYFDFIMASLKPTGRLVAVGDNKQNIFGWAGAFTNGMNKIVEETNAIELPLSVTYRCPLSHIEIANSIFPGTEAPDWAVDGSVLDINEEQLLDHVETIYNGFGEILIMCRRNAPVVRFAVKLLQRRIPATIRGRDFCANVKSIVKQMGMTGKKPKRDMKFTENFLDFADAWLFKQKQILTSKNAGEVAFQSVQDKYDSVVILYESTEAKTVWDFIKEIDKLFSDDPGKIKLASIHRSKGLEAQNTAILEYSKMPFSWKNQTTQQAHAENCVWFVAVTRSKETMYLVESE